MIDPYDFEPLKFNPPRDGGKGWCFASSHKIEQKDDTIHIWIWYRSMSDGSYEFFHKMIPEEVSHTVH